MYMQNKNLIVLLIMIVVISAMFFLMTSERAQAPALEETNTTAAPTDYINLTVAAAEAKATTDGVLFRVVEKDGQQLPTTRDYRPGRINAVVTDGIVTDYTVEGMNPVPDETPIPINHDTIIGMTVTQAEVYATTNNVLFRVGTIDGEGQPVTMDYRVGRITASVADGVVVSYTVEQ